MFNVPVVNSSPVPLSLVVRWDIFAGARAVD